MNTRKNCVFVCAGVLLAAVVLTSSASANLLVDPGYEANALTGYGNVLTNFPGFQGIWGAENGLITGVDNGITPAQGSKMLRMDDEGNVTTQGFQVTDISAYAGPVDAGSATVTLSALFNVESFVPAAGAGVYLQFFSASNYASQIGTGTGGSLSLDNLANTWETAAVTTPVPVGTRWILSQVYYSNASLIGVDGAVHPGYVDAADMRVTPEPTGLALLALGALLGFRRR